MSRRGRSGPTISLFSFQDIITSVTAIVTVITLLLALDLVQRKESRASDSSAALADQLTARLERVEAERTELQNLAKAADDVIQQAAGTSAQELRDEIAACQTAIKQLQVEQKRHERQQRSWQSRKHEELRTRFDQAPLKTEQVELDRQVADLERRVAEEQTDERPIYALPKGSRQDGWIAVVSDQQITVAPMGRPARPLEFAATGPFGLGQSASRNFAAWIDQQSLSSAYFLILIRPKGSASFTELEQILDRKQISHGVDLIAIDQSIFHPERGADH